MPSEEQVVSPPHPGPGTSITRLYDYLVELRDWVSAVCGKLHASLGKNVFPALGVRSRLSSYVSLPVTCHYRHYLAIRYLRREWDTLLRDYDTDWNNPDCIRRRIVLVHQCIYLLNESYTTYEHWEAQAQHADAKIIASVQRMLDYLNREVDTTDEAQA